MTRIWIAVVLAAELCGVPAWAETPKDSDALKLTLPGETAAMPDPRAVLQAFMEQDGGGVQRVVAATPHDAATVRQVRLHLRDIRDRILRGDFPWQAKASGSVLVGYRDVPAGGELAFQAEDAGVVAALHGWFEAQAADERANVIVAHGLRR